MLRRLLFGGAGRAAAASQGSAAIIPRAPMALLSTRAALQPASCAAAPAAAAGGGVPARPVVGDYLRPHIEALKALQKLLRPPQQQQQEPARQQIKLPSPLQPAPLQEGGGLVGFECLNRNARRGKKANHGKRAVSSARRKYKTKKFGRK